MGRAEHKGVESKQGTHIQREHCIKAMRAEGLESRPRLPVPEKRMKVIVGQEGLDGCWACTWPRATVTHSVFFFFFLLPYRSWRRT